MVTVRESLRTNTQIDQSLQKFLFKYLKYFLKNMKNL